MIQLYIPSESECREVNSSIAKLMFTEDPFRLRPFFTPHTDEANAGWHVYDTVRELRRLHVLPVVATEQTPWRISTANIAFKVRMPLLTHQLTTLIDVFPCSFVPRIHPWCAFRQKQPMLS